MQVFKYKDVLFGLRNEYLKNKEELDDLKQNVESLKEYYFYVSKYTSKINPEIICHINNGSKPKLVNSKELVNNDLFRIKNLENYNDIQENILFSDFANLMYKDYISLFYEKNQFGLSITPNIIDLYLTKGIYNGVSLTYLLDDLVLLNYFRGNLTNEIFNYIMNIEIPKPLFNEYMQDVIEDNEKDIILLDDLGGNTEVLQIYEEEKRLVLKRGKRV